MAGTGTVPSRTIPQVLADAAARDPDGIWVRSDEGTLSFAGALGQVAAAAARLRDAGVGHGDLVMVTARTTPEYLICWLALTALGAVVVSVNPRSAPAELAGLAQQTRPRALITDAGLAALVSQAGMAGLVPLGVLDAGELAGDWAHAGSRGQPAAKRARRATMPARPAVLPPAASWPSAFPGSRSARQTSRCSSRHPAPPGGPSWSCRPTGPTSLAGEGFPYWMELTAQDRLMTSLPLFHINAPAYSVMGSLACGAGLILLPRFSASGFLDAARRHGATEFNAIGAMLEILMRQPAAARTTRTRRCGSATPARRPRGSGRRRWSGGSGLRIVVGYAMSESPYGLIWPHGTRPFGTLGAVRQHPVARRDQRRAGGRRRRPGGRPGRHRRAAAPQPGR